MVGLVCPEGRVVGTDLGEVHITVSHDSERTHILGGRLLRHCNGKPLVEVYGSQTTDQRGGTIALNFFAPDGRLIDERVVEHRASARERILEILPKSALVLTLLFLFLSLPHY